MYILYESKSVNKSVCIITLNNRYNESLLNTYQSVSHLERLVNTSGSDESLNKEADFMLMKL